MTAAQTQLVLDAVCNYYDVPINAVMGDSRRQEIARPRHVACFLLRNHGGMSYPRIGLLFDRNHTTILQAVRTVEDNDELRADADRILVELAADHASRPSSLIDERRRRRIIHQFGASAGADDITVAIRDVFVRASLELAGLCPDNEDFVNALHRLTEAQLWSTRAATYPVQIQDGEQQIS